MSFTSKQMLLRGCITGSTALSYGITPTVGCVDGSERGFLSSSAVGVWLWRQAAMEAALEASIVSELASMCCIDTQRQPA